jgi:hypothetical protein
LEGFRDHELTEIRDILVQYREIILQAWQNEEAKRGHGVGQNQAP